MEYSLLPYAKRAKIEELNASKQKVPKAKKNPTNSPQQELTIKDKKGFKSSQFDNYEDYITKTYSRPPLRRSFGQPIKTGASFQLQDTLIIENEKKHNNPIETFKKIFKKKTT